MFCPKCGTHSKGKRFCTRCGLEQLLPRHAGTPVKQSSQSGQSGKTPDELLGRKLDEKYLLETKLGTGGMGTVYRAHRLLIGDAVAVKVLHPRQAGDPRTLARFRREAQVLTRLQHRGVASVYDFATSSDGYVYLVMELAAGESLRALLNRQGKLAESVALEITTQLCDVLTAAHEHGIIHRDLKPENILVQQTTAGPRVKLLDFGIACLRDAASQHLTETGGVLGTPHYMSPEQCLGEALDGRTDVYSLGVVLYEMLCGVTPFNAAVVSAVIVQQVNQTPAPLHTHTPALTAEVAAVVLRALAKRPDARPQTAAAFAKELRAASNQAAMGKAAPAIQRETTGQALSAAGKATPAPLTIKVVSNTRKPARRSVAPMLMATALLLLLVAGFGVQRYKSVPPVVAAPVTELPSPTPAATPAPKPRWIVIAEHTRGVSAAEQGLAEADQTSAVIAPGGQLALELRAGEFFGEGPGADVQVHSAATAPVSYTVFVRNDATAAWQRIDVNRRGFAQGVKGHDMGHHGVPQARQLLIRNEASVDLPIDAISVVYQDKAAAAPNQHHHTH